jgi:Ser/Thr protein kinase RdoA (MazF antagonist)
LLPKYRFSSESSLKLLSLSENAVFLVEARQDTARLILRVHMQGYNAPAEIDSELNWLCAIIAETDLETVRPVPTKEGILRNTLADGRSIVGFEYIKGGPLGAGSELLPTMEMLGVMTAKLHLHSKSWIPPTSFQRKRWDFMNCLGDRAIWGNWQQSVGLSSKGHETITKAVAVLEKRLLSWGTGVDRFGLIHGDLKSANLLIGSVGPVLLDFDDCGFGWYLYDFGCAATDLNTVKDMDICSAAWVRGYRSVSSLSLRAEKMLPTFVLLRRIMTMAWAASHTYSTVAMRDYGVAYTELTLKCANELLSREFAH